MWQIRLLTVFSMQRALQKLDSAVVITLIVIMLAWTSTIAADRTSPCAGQEPGERGQIQGQEAAVHIRA